MSTSPRKKKIIILIKLVDEDFGRKLSKSLARVRNFGKWLILRREICLYKN